MGAVLILIALRYFFYAPGLLSAALLKHSLFLYPPYAWLPPFTLVPLWGTLVTLAYKFPLLFL